MFLNADTFKHCKFDHSDDDWCNYTGLGVYKRTGVTYDPATKQYSNGIFIQASAERNQNGGRATLVID